MRPAALKLAPAVLVPVAAAWVLAADGPVVRPAVAVATVAAALALAWTSGAGALRRGPALWLAAMLAWAALDAVLRPVAAYDAARVLAAGVVALALLLVVARPRAAAWGRLAVVAGGACAAAWMVAERAAHAARPAGPFGNPNGSATAALLGLALAPSLRLPLGARVPLMALAAAGVVASGSRAALIGACVVAAAWGFAGRRRRGLALAAGLVAAVAVLGLAFRFVRDRDPLRYERLRIWGVVARVAAAELPFGCGPGGYADAALAHNFPRDGEFARFARLPDLAESDLLAVPASLGIPGAVLAAGLLASVAAAVRRRGPAAWSVAAAVGVTSAVNSQLMVPVVVWMAALALGSVLDRPRPARRAGVRGATAAALSAAAVAAAVVLALPDWGAGPAPERLVEAAEAANRARRPTDATLADAEAQAWRACAERPRFARAWKALGNLRLARANVRDEADLAAAAAAAFAHARRANPLDVWAAVGEGRALLALGDRPGARDAFNAAVRLEPNCAPAWIELAYLHLAQGEIGAARAALGRAQAIVRDARGRSFVTAYERALASADPAAVARLRAALGEGT